MPFSFSIHKYFCCFYVLNTLGHRDLFSRAILKWTLPSTISLGVYFLFLFFHVKVFFVLDYICVLSGFLLKTFPRYHRFRQQLPLFVI